LVCGDASWGCCARLAASFISPSMSTS
jgi:hypothetical protein